MCVWLMVAVVSTQEESEKAEKPASGPKKPVFREPSYPEGDVYFVETFTDAKKVWKRFKSLCLFVLKLLGLILTNLFL